MRQAAHSSALVRLPAFVRRCSSRAALSLSVAEARGVTDKTDIYKLFYSGDDLLDVLLLIFNQVRLLEKAASDKKRQAKLVKVGARARRPF
jgi:hypothetical protein